MSLTSNPINSFRINATTTREGIPIEKGVALTQEFLEKNEKLLQQYMNFFMLYPDLFLDLVRGKDCWIDLYYYQRIVLRAMMRYRFFFGTFTRATSKSFLAILSQYLSCMFIPKSKRFVVSQFQKASLAITRQKLEEIWDCYPLLRAELKSEHMAMDYIELEFKNDSKFQILALSAATRGQRADGGVMEEAALLDGEVFSEVIIPTMNVARQCPGGGTNPDEPHAQQTYITSAGVKTSFAYERLIELTIQSVISPNDYFICGASYELPLHYGLFDEKSIRDQKLSSSFSEEGFARESLSIWTGSSKDSWFDNNRLIKCRKLLNAELAAKPNLRNPDAFYVISIDVARTGNNDSSIMVIKVIPREGAWKKKVVFTRNLTNMNLVLQAGWVKYYNSIYQPREIVIDGNGVGHGLVDQLVLPSVGPHGELFDPIYVMNDPESYPVPRGQKAIVYDIKANAALNSEIYSNLFIQFNNGHVELLANERIAKEKLLSTKKGQRMNLYQREKFLYPYVMTSRLIDEMNNLKLRPTGSANQLAVEQISKRINKDRVSAIAYGLYRIKYHEDKAIRRNKRNSGKGAMLFYSSLKSR